MVKYGEFEKHNLTGIWFCVRRSWSCENTKCNGFDFVRENGKIVAYPEWEADDVVSYYQAQ